MNYLRECANAIPEDLAPAMGQLVDEMEQICSDVEASGEEFRMEMYRQIKNHFMDDVTTWEAVGEHVWTFFNLKNAARYGEFYEKMGKVLHPKVVMVLLALEKEVIEMERSTRWSLFSGVTLESRYLLRDAVTREVVETPTRMFARAAAGALVNMPDWDEYMKAVLDMLRTFNSKACTLATPGIANGGRANQMLSSCFLVPLGIYHGHDPDSMPAISRLLATCMNISAAGGGIGFTFPVRSYGQPIKGSGGLSKGVVDALMPFEAAMDYCDQGGSKGKKVGGGRKGAWAAYFEPHHPDIVRILEMKREVRIAQQKAAKGEAMSSGMQMLNNLFVGLWVSDLFMERVKHDREWSFFSTDTAPGLENMWGERYRSLYTSYEADGRAVGKMRARDLFTLICQTLVETSGPYVLFKDACNALSPQQNIGTIQCSNLCTEIVEYTSPQEIAVCNLASVSLPAFVASGRKGEGGYDYASLRTTVGRVARTLFHSIHATTYPDVLAEQSNKKRKPIAIGVQGFAQVLMANKWAWDSEDARKFNRRMIMNMYYAALDAAVSLCEEGHAPYTGFTGSCYERGVFPWEMFAKRSGNDRIHLDEAPELDWEGLRERMKRGVAMSLLIALMPTATTSQILGNYEAFAPIMSNMFLRSTEALRVAVVNPYLVAELKALGVWSDALKNRIVANKGSVRGIDEIPLDVQRRYPTVYELSPKLLGEFMLDRVPFVDQAQSYNVWMAEDPTKPPLDKRIGAHLIYLWERGAKNGVYYFTHRPVRSREAVGGEVANGVAGVVGTLTGSGPPSSPSPTTNPTRTSGALTSSSEGEDDDDEMQSCPIDGSCDNCGA